MSKLLNGKWAVFCLIFVVILAVFGRTIWFDYVQLDEGILILNNKFFISDLSNFFEVFKHDINYPSAVAPYYRPIFILSFMLNSQLGTGPVVYHVGNILLHALAVFMLFGLLRELGIKKSLSVWFSLLFAVHPAVTPVVAWVPGRIEAILTIFTVLSFISFIRFLRTSDWRYLVTFFASFAVAMFTKEVAIALLPVLLFYYLTHKNEKGSEMVVTLSAGAAVIVLAWFFIRKNILAAQIVDAPFSQMLSVFWSNLSGAILYLGKTVLPFNLTVLPVLESSTLIYGFTALTILLAYWMLKKVKFSNTSAMGVLWFLVFLAPSLVSYNSPAKMVFFEHRLYLPLLGIIIFFASSMSLRGQVPFLSQKRYLTPFAVAVVILFSVLAFNYSSAYKNKTVFWQKAVADSPKSAEAHNGLATAYLTDGKEKEAEAEFVETIELNPNERRVHLLLGLYYFDRQIYDKAKSELEKEIEIDPNQFLAYHGLGRIYIQRKNYKEAERYLLKSIELNPEYVLARQDLTVLYFSQNKHLQTVSQLKGLLKLQRVENLDFHIRQILEIYAKEIAEKQGF